MINLEDFTNKLISNNISANQLIFCYYVMEGDLANFTKCYKDAYKITPTEINNLIEKDLMGSPTFGDYSFSKLYVTEKFKKEYVLETEEWAKELFEAYFKKIEINNRIIPARNMSLESFTKKYMDIVNGNKKEHEKILETTIKYVDGRSTGDLGLAKYLETKFWEILDDTDDPFKKVTRSAIE